jgi:hypothetical protein
MASRKSKSRKSRRCKKGALPSGKCRKNKCSRGITKKSRRCKKKSGPKRSRSRSRSRSSSRSRKSRKSKSRSRKSRKSRKSSKKKMTKNQFYCVSCRKRVTVPSDEIYMKTYRNKNKKTKQHTTPAMRGKHTVCGTNLTKFVSKDKYPQLVKEFGTKR